MNSSQSTDKLLIEKYIEEVGDLELNSPVPNFTTLMVSLRWSSEKYYSAHYDQFISVPVIGTMKEGDSRKTLSTTHSQAVTEEIFKNYWKDPQTIDNKLTKQKQLIEQLKEAYKQVTENYVQSHELSRLKELLSDIKDTEMNINALGWWAMYPEKDFVIRMLRELGADIKPREIDNIWDEATRNVAGSFDIRKTETVLRLLNENAGWEEIARRCQYMFAGFNGAQSLSEVEDALIEEYGSFASSKSKQKEKLADIKADQEKVKEDFRAWVNNLDDDHKKVVKFMQAAVEMRDKLQDYIGRYVVILERIGDRLMKEANLDSGLLHYTTFNELTADTSDLAKLNSELKKRRKNGVTILVHKDDTIELETGTYEETKEGMEKLYYSQQDVDPDDEVDKIEGSTASEGTARGAVKVVMNPTKDSDKFNKGDILVTGMTRPDFVPLMKKSAAIVTDEGGVTSHAAIVSRELGKPCIIGTKAATQILNDGDKVKVDADEGVVKILDENQDE